MKFITCYTIAPAQFKDAIARFLKTGALPPQGVKMLGRWHAHKKGWIISETDDATKIAEWTAQWGDLLDFEVMPVVEDAELGAVLSKLAT